MKELLTRIKVRKVNFDDATEINSIPSVERKKEDEERKKIEELNLRRVFEKSQREVQKANSEIDASQNIIQSTSSAAMCDATQNVDPDRINQYYNVNDKERSKITAQDQRIYNAVQDVKKAIPVQQLARNPRTRDLFNSYAKAAMTKTGNRWKYPDTELCIARDMAQDGRSLQRIRESMRCSPSLIGIGDKEIDKQIKHITAELPIKRTQKMVQKIETPREGGISKP